MEEEQMLTKEQILDMLDAGQYKELKEEIIKELRDFYEEKMAPVDNEQRKSIEKMLYLQIVDRDWREHLYQMDILKTGIGLRGYNHRDPLTEYKKESYNLFVELVMRLKSDSIRTLHSIRFKTQEEIEAERRAIAELQAKLQEEEQKKLKMSGADKGGEDLEETKNVPYRAPKKIGRNEPCPCGSGKKYKDCHGKSGPKKGLFANND